MTTNPFEALGRARKVKALVEAADREAMAGGLQPLNPAHAAGILDCWKRATAAHWAELERKAGLKNPASDDTKRDFLVWLEERTLPSAHARTVTALRVVS